jgi:CheY-like chemotaxis protein
VDKKKILIIDDEPPILLVSKRRLEANNYEVITAADGKEGIEKAVSFKPDLILLDLVMPELNGYEVCRRLKACEETKEIPIIIFTASSPFPEDFGNKATALGAVGYLTKPFESDDLLSTIEKSISGGR